MEGVVDRQTQADQEQERSQRGANQEGYLLLPAQRPRLNCGLTEVAVEHQQPEPTIPSTTPRIVTNKMAHSTTTASPIAPAREACGWLNSLPTRMPAS